MKVNVDDIKSISQNKRSRFFKDSFFKDEIELVTIKDAILKVPNLKLVFLTFERSEIRQKLKNKKKGFALTL